MPTISAMDPGLRYDDRDAEMAQTRARNQDYMMRQYLQNQQLQAQQSAEQNRMGAQERMFGQELADRAAGRTASYGQATELARIGQQPAMASLDFMRQKYGDERSDTSGTRDYNNALAQFRMNELRGIMGGSSDQTANDAIKAGFKITDPQGYGVARFDSGGSGTSMNDRDRRALRFGLLGIQAPSDPNEQAQEMARKIIAARMASADPTDLGALGQAYQTGDLSKIPVQQKAAIDPAMLQEAIQSQVRSFGEKDAATIGFDPTENDVQDIIRRRDQLAQVYQSQMRLPPDAAKERANFIIEEQVRPNADRWGTEWIARLKEALRGTSTPEPAQMRSPDNIDPFQGGGL